MVDIHSLKEIDDRAAARAKVLVKHDAEAAIFNNMSLRVQHCGYDQVVAELKESAIEAEYRQKTAFADARAKVEALVARQPLRELHIPSSLFI